MKLSVALASVALLWVAGHSSALPAVANSLGDSSGYVVERRAELSNELRAIEKWNGYLIIAAGHRIAVIEAKTDSPRVLGQSSPFQGRVDALGIHGHFAIAAFRSNETSFLASVNLLEPTRPTVVSMLDLELLGPVSIAIGPSGVILATFGPFLRAVFIDETGGLKREGRYDSLRGSCGNIVIRDDTAMVGCRDPSSMQDELVALDISRLPFIDRLGSSRMPEQIGALSIDQDLIYVLGNNSNALYVVQLQANHEPVVIGRSASIGAVPTTGRNSDSSPVIVALPEERLAIIDPELGLALVNVGLKERPTPIQAFDIRFRGVDVVSSDDTVYVVAGNLGYGDSRGQIASLNVDRNNRWILRSSFHPYHHGKLTFVTKSDNLIFLLTKEPGGGSVYALDPKGIDGPVILNRLLLPNRDWSWMIAFDRYIVVGDDALNRIVIDKGDPRKLANLGVVRNIPPIILAVQGGLLFGLAQENRELVIIDISDPLKVKAVATYVSDRTIEDIAVVGNTIYCLDSYSPNEPKWRLTVLDITDRSRPRMSSQIALRIQGRDIVIHDHYLLVASGGMDLYGIDIDTLQNPVRLITIPLAGGHSVESDGQYIYTYQAFFDVFYMSVFDLLPGLERPRPVTSYGSTNEDVPYSLYPEGGVLYYVTNRGDFLIDAIIRSPLSMSPTLTPAVTYSPTPSSTGTPEPVATATTPPTQTSPTTTPGSHVPSIRLFLPVVSVE